MTTIINEYGIPASQNSEYDIRVGGQAKRMQALYEEQALYERMQAERQRWEWGTGTDRQIGVSCDGRPPQPVKSYLASHNRNRSLGTALSAEQEDRLTRHDQLFITELKVNETGNPFNNYQYYGVCSKIDSNTKSFADPITAQLLGVRDNEDVDGVAYNDYVDPSKTELIDQVEQFGLSAGETRRAEMAQMLGYGKKKSRKLSLEGWT